MHLSQDRTKTRPTWFIPLPFASAQAGLTGSSRILGRGGRSGRTCLVPQSLVRLCEGHRLLSQRVEQCQRNDFSGGLCEGPRDKSHAQRNVCGRNRSEREPTRAAVEAVFTKERLRALISTCVRQEQAARKQHEAKCNEIAGNERKCAYFALLPGGLHVSLG